MRILLVKLSSLGDVIHNLPVASDLARQFPAAQIDWAVESPYAALVAMHPAVRTVFPVGLRHLRRHLFSAAAWSTFLSQRRALVAQSYEAILDTQGLFKSAWISGWAEGPSSGFDAASAREPLAARLYQNRFGVARQQHAVTRNRALAAAAFGYEMAGPADYGLHAVTGPNAPSRAPYVVFLHATSRANKMWPDGSWVDLGRRCRSTGVEVFLPWGNADELAASERLASAIGGAIVPAAMPLTGAAQLLAGAMAVVGVDTGLAHLAVALGRPTIGLYISTQPNLTGLHSSRGALNLGGGSEEAPVIPSVDDAWAALAGQLASTRD